VPAAAEVAERKNDPRKDTFSAGTLRWPRTANALDNTMRPYTVTREGDTVDTEAKKPETWQIFMRGHGVAQIMPQATSEGMEKLLALATTASASFFNWSLAQTRQVSQGTIPLLPLANNRAAR